MNAFKTYAEDREIRIQNARNGWVDSVMEQFGFTREEALRILEVFRDAQLARINPTLGVVELRHGSAWDKDVMKRALEWRSV